MGVIDIGVGGVTLEALRPSWIRALRASNRSKKTQDTYVSSLNDLMRFLQDAGMPQRVDSITRDYIEAYIADLLERAAPATASVRFRALQQFFRWALDDGEITSNPMERMTRPIVPETDKRILSTEELRALLATTEGNEFERRRDRAIFLVMLDTGARLAGVAGLQVDDVNLDMGIVRIFGKGRRHYLASIGTTTVKALDRYLRARRGHRYGSRPELWLARKGPLSASGIVQVVRRRSRDASLKGVHPHAFRHTFAHRMKASGASDEDVMALGDWRSRDAMQGYGRSLRAERALATHKKLSPADGL